MVTTNSQRWKAKAKVRDGEARRQTFSDRLSGKKSKQDEDVQYRASPTGQKCCFECVNYKKPGNEVSNCKLVAGPVYAQDVCDLFSPQTKG